MTGALLALLASPWGAPAVALASLAAVTAGATLGAAYDRLTTAARQRLTRPRRTPMHPMTPEQRGEAAFFLPPGQNPAAPELVASVACRARALEEAAEDRQALVKFTRDTAAVIRRLLAVEQQLAACRAAYADAIALAADLPDDGLTPDDLTRLAAAHGLDLTADITAAEALRDAEALAGVG